MMTTRRKLVLLCIGIVVASFGGWALWPAPPDVKLMWETSHIHGNTGSNAPNQQGSSERAVKAAGRVFSTLPLVGMTRQQVLETLGDPKTSSDSIYNFPFYPPTPGALVYRFDTGSGGWQFDLVLNDHDVVTKVVTRGIE
jgi:hypothetical protein